VPELGQAHLDGRRRQIVDAASRPFARHGFAETSIAEIVAQSVLSNGAIFRHFASKEQIVIAVCEQACDAFP
jgi:AcrR family transcriptional regulator